MAKYSSWAPIRAAKVFALDGAYRGPSHFARDLYVQQRPRWAWRFSTARPAKCGPACTGALSHLESAMASGSARQCRLGALMLLVRNHALFPSPLFGAHIYSFGECIRHCPRLWIQHRTKDPAFLVIQ